MAINARHRRNPMTDVRNIVLIDDEEHTIEYIEEYNDYGFFANEGILFESPSSVVVVEDDSAQTEFTEVGFNTAPSAGQFSVDYEPPNATSTYKNTGFIRCNPADNGKRVLLSYKGLGTINHPVFSLAGDESGRYLKGTTIVDDLRFSEANLRFSTKDVLKRFYYQNGWQICKFENIEDYSTIANSVSQTIAWGHNEAGVVCIAAGNGSSVVLFRSVDNGESFVRITGHGLPSNAIPRDIATNGNKFIMITGNTGTAQNTRIYKSTDAGLTWSAVTISGFLFNDGNNNFVSFRNCTYANDVLIISGVMGLFRSTNDGETLTPLLTSGNTAARYTHAINPLSGVMLAVYTLPSGGSTDLTLYRYTDDGATSDGTFLLPGVSAENLTGGVWHIVYSVYDQSFFVSGSYTTFSGSTAGPLLNIMYKVENDGAEAEDYILVPQRKQYSTSDQFYGYIFRPTPISEKTYIAMTDVSNNKALSFVITYDLFENEERLIPNIRQLPVIKNASSENYREMSTNSKHLIVSGNRAIMRVVTDSVSNRCEFIYLDLQET